MKHALSLLAIVALAAGSFTLGVRHGWQKRHVHSFQAGRLWGMYERAVQEQRIRSAQSHLPLPVPTAEQPATPPVLTAR